MNLKAFYLALLSLIVFIEALPGRAPAALNGAQDSVSLSNGHSHALSHLPIDLSTSVVNTPTVSIELSSTSTSTMIPASTVSQSTLTLAQTEAILNSTAYLSL